MKFAAFASTFLLVVNAAAAATSAPRYTITDLGAKAHSESTAEGVNNLGQVVGECFYRGDIDYDGSSAPAIFTSRSVTRFTDLSEDVYGSANAINNAGQIVGETNGHAFFYASGVMTDLTPGATSGSSAPAINDSGQIVVNLGNHIFVYSGSTMTDLGLGEGYGINARGQVVGSYNPGSGDSRAFLYTAGVISDLGTLGGTASAAFGVNERGQVVGTASTRGNVTSHAFVFQNREMADLHSLDNLESDALAINAAGQIVGYSYLKGSQSTHAILWFEDRLIDLNRVDFHSGKSTNWVLISARGINDRGQIVGEGTLKGYSHAFVLSPVPTIHVIGGTARVTGNAHVVLRGTSNAIVQRIAYRVGTKGRLRNAIGTGLWHFRATVRPGKNIISITARSISGAAEVEKVTITRR